MSFREQFWETICAFRELLSILFGINAALIALSLLSIAWGEPGTEGYVIAVMSLAIGLFTAVLMGYCLWRCSRARKP